MRSEQQLALELIKRELSLTQWMKGVEIAEKLKERNIPLEEIPQCVEATPELSDPEFRKAAYATLELIRKTGKTPGEVEARIKELSSQIEGKRKEKSEWDKKTEKASEKTEEWEQKRRNERAEFEREQSINRTTLEKSREELEEELKQHNVVRENVKEFIAHKAQLQGTGLDLPTFNSILGEMVQKEGINPDIGKKVKERIKQMGSLDKVIAEREGEISKLSKKESEKKRKISKLSEEESEKNRSLERLNGGIEQRGQIIKRQEQTIEDNKKAISEHAGQYELFIAFLSMLDSSSTVRDSLLTLGRGLQALGKDKGPLSQKPERLRALFVSFTMGIHIGSIRCNKCKISFLVKRPKDFHRLSYFCPVCGSDKETKDDDSFLELMTSPDLAKRIQNAKNILGEGEQNASD